MEMQSLLSRQPQSKVRDVPRTRGNNRGVCQVVFLDNVVSNFTRRSQKILIRFSNEALGLGLG